MQIKVQRKLTVPPCNLLRAIIEGPEISNHNQLVITCISENTRNVLQENKVLSSTVNDQSSRPLLQI